ncbi:hypothetical protein [Streptacidiphilus neutrinimicus]|uniref:hypothetical protein n=1 Tax=Streptacidiphilus neutrinimicus TaxID=105420 RepID=UPI0005A7C853|nr:hypothetical protein [Streptacidiphilus neutrinimicus]
MRTLMTIRLGNEKTTQAISDKRMAEFMQTNLARLQPEAVYFATVDGQRGGFVVFDLKEPAQMPSIAEPFFQELGADVTFSPAMVPDDVMRGLDPGYQPPA